MKNEKRERFISSLIMTWISLLVAVSANGATTRIMPLGDSITSSSGGHASYRYWLWHDLVNAGFDIQFVGTQYGVYGGQPLYADFDQHHQGMWGASAAQLVSQVAGFARAAQPDVVLMDLGTTDVQNNASPADVVSNLRKIIDNLRTVNPNVVVLLAQLTPIANDSGHLIAQVNALIPAMAAQENQGNSPVRVVNLYTGYSAATDTFDGVHPDTSGEQKIASRWFPALAGKLVTYSGVPDLRIRNMTTPNWTGVGRYNADGAGQTLSYAVKAGVGRTGYVWLKNTGKAEDTFTIQGDAGDDNFDVSFKIGRNDITADIVNGSYTVVLAPGKSFFCRFGIAPKKQALVGAVKAEMITATAANNSLVLDTVRINMRVVP